MAGDTPAARSSEDELAAAWREISALVAAGQRRVDRAVEQAGVSPGWVSVLAALLDAPDRRLPMSALAAGLGMTPGGFTKLADRMAREGLIDRRGSDLDRRVVHARLTDAGVDVARRAVRAHTEAVAREIVPSVPGDALEAVRRHLADLADGAEQGPVPVEAPGTDAQQRRASDRG